MGLDMSDLARFSPKAQEQILRKLSASQNKGGTRASKYKAEKDTRPAQNARDGALKFDSKAEARRFDELMVLLKAGKIRNLRLQQQFTLVEGYVTPEGDRVRPMKYVADFAYERSCAQLPDGTPTLWATIVEDVKGVRTQVYKNKAKLMAQKYGIVIREVEA